MGEWPESEEDWDADEERQATVQFLFGAVD